MKTFAFHSYKGGTGRTMALANCATALAQSGYNVVAIDLDLDAPGLAFKFGVEDRIKAGYLDYLLTWTANERASNDLRDSRLGMLQRIAVQDDNLFSDLQGSPEGKLTLISAGDVFSANYFYSVSSTQLANRYDFSDDGGSSIAHKGSTNAEVNWDAFKGDLNDIKEAFGNPDFLLVDCRSAHDMASTAILAWADHVFEFFPCNKEGVFGTNLVVDMLKTANEARDRPIGITPVATRFPSDAKISALEEELIEIACKLSSSDSALIKSLFNSSVWIREQRSFEVGDNLVLKSEEKSKHSLAYDYASLLDIITCVDREQEFFWEDRLGLNRAIEEFEKTFKYLQKQGLLLNSDDQKNVALRRETLEQLVSSINNDQMKALEAIEVLGERVQSTISPEKLVSNGFFRAGANAGQNFGKSAQIVGKVWAPGKIPTGALARLRDWCEFDREAGFGDWTPKYDEEIKSGSIEIKNHFLADVKNRVGDHFIKGYVLAVVSFLVAPLPWSGSAIRLNEIDLDDLVDTSLDKMKSHEKGTMIVDFSHA